jgi:hypothetical protein
MDISAVLGVKQANTNVSIGVAVAKKEMDIQKIEGEAIIQMIESSNPAQGNIINERM